MADRCATQERSWHSCTDALPSMATPVARVAMRSWWSPKMDRAWVASERQVTWNTAGSSSPATLYILGIMSMRPWLAVMVVASAPPAKQPCSAPATPFSDCISFTTTGCPKKFSRPATAQDSTVSAMCDAGVMGKIMATSDSA